MKNELQQLMDSLIRDEMIIIEFQGEWFWNPRSLVDRVSEKANFFLGKRGMEKIDDVSWHCWILPN